MLQHFNTITDLEALCQTWDNPIGRRGEFYIFTTNDDPELDAKVNIDPTAAWKVEDTWEIDGDNSKNGVLIARQPFIGGYRFAYLKDDLEDYLLQLEAPGMETEDDVSKLGPELQAYRVGWYAAKRQIMKLVDEWLDEVY